MDLKEARTEALLGAVLCSKIYFLFVGFDRLTVRISPDYIDTATGNRAGEKYFICRCHSNIHETTTDTMDFFLSMSHIHTDIHTDKRTYYGKLYAVACRKVARYHRKQLQLKLVSY